MAPKQPTASYSTFLRARRHARQGAGRSAGTATVVQIGNWALADEEGSLVIINQITGDRTILMRGEEAGAETKEVE